MIVGSDKTHASHGPGHAQLCYKLGCAFLDELRVHAFKALTPVYACVDTGLSLYAADVIMRICQAQSLSAMVLAGHAAQAAGKVMEGDVAALQIPVSKVNALRVENLCTCGVPPNPCLLHLCL